MENSFSHFQNDKCKYYPCHKNAGEHFNCMFCYCPLYVLGDKCGGNFTYTQDGIKDCSCCLIPHSENGYSYVISKFDEIKKLAQRKD